MSRVGVLRVALALVAWTGLSAFVLADDWMVDRLRGEALVMSDGSWSPLQRGDIVSDSSRIRSAEGSRVTFTRGAEAIELSGATEIRIFDEQGQRMTTIMQAYGTVTVEAERLQIQHFSIQTPFLAAIVKGTRFTVHSDDTQSSVDVARGLVQVQDYVHGIATDIAPGQSAVVSDQVALDVSGGGKYAPMVTLEGKMVPPADGPEGHGQNANAAGGQANGNGHAEGHGNAQGNSAGGQGNGNAGNSNGNGNSSGGQGNSGNTGNGNTGNGNSGNGNGGNGNSGNGNSGNSNSGNGNANTKSLNGNGGNSGKGDDHGNDNDQGHGNSNGHGSHKDD